MKIAIICGCLEEGKDGVGDYSRILASSLLNRGHQPILIALNDKFIANYDSTTKQDIVTFRCPKQDWQKKYTKVSQILSEFDPDLVSIQFVPYAFSDKGLPFELLKFFQKTAVNYKWHIMFHELWIEDSRSTSIKNFIVRELQKNIIKKLLSILSPSVSTSNSYYQKMLNKIGYTSKVIPIFSNLPKAKLAYEKLSDRDYLSACYFGNVQVVQNAVDKIEALVKQTHENFSKKLRIYHIGKSRNKFVSDFFSNLNKIEGCEVIFMGFMEKENAANLIESCEIGLSHYPPLLFQKSGSIASILYNKTPVILLNEDSSGFKLDLPELKCFNEVNDLKSFIDQPDNFHTKYDESEMINYLNQL